MCEGGQELTEDGGSEVVQARWAKNWEKIEMKRKKKKKKNKKDQTRG